MLINKAGNWEKLEREPLNPVDGNAVAIVRSGTVVGHVPHNLSVHFLTRGGCHGCHGDESQSRCWIWT